MLTKDDTRALREASDVYGINIDGQNYLRTVKRFWGEPERDDIRIDIPVEGNGANGFFTSAWSFPWQTLRAGDRVYLKWDPDAKTNENLRSVKMHADALFVQITRGKKTFEYLAAVSVCPDNSARMCRSEERVGASFG